MFNDRILSKGHGLLLMFYIIVRNEMACSV